MACLIGKWKLCPELTTGYDEFLDALGTSKEEKEMARNLEFSLDISQDGDNWKQVLEIVGMPETKVYAFKSGEPFTFKSLDGKKNMRSTITVQNDKFTERLGEEQADGSYKEWDVLTEMDGEMLKITQTYKGAVEVLKLKKI